MSARDGASYDDMIQGLVKVLDSSDVQLTNRYGISSRAGRFQRVHALVFLIRIYMYIRVPIYMHSVKM